MYDKPVSFQYLNGTFTTELMPEIVDYIFNIVNKLSLEDPMSFALGLTVRLENDMICRYVMSRLIKDKILEKMKQEKFNKLKIKLPDRTLDVSFGYVKVAEDRHEYVYGILYDV